MDIRKWLYDHRGCEPEFHALLGDFPYSISFMNKKWDKSDLVFDPKLYKRLADHLLPGAFGMVFASSRQYHRVACAIEDAGMVLHPSIFGFCYGSGFPKATNISKRSF